MSKEEARKELKKRKDRDSEMVTGVFKNLENQSSAISRGALSFGFKGYPGDEFMFYEFVDGEKYRIPLGVAKHINNNCYYYEYKNANHEMEKMGIQAVVNPGGRMTANNHQNYKIAKKIHRFAFYPLDFTDAEMERDLRPTNLAEVAAF